MKYIWIILKVQLPVLHSVLWSKVNLCVRDIFVHLKKYINMYICVYIYIYVNMLVAVLKYEIQYFYEHTHRLGKWLGITTVLRVNVLLPSCRFVVFSYVTLASAFFQFHLCIICHSWWPFRLECSFVLSFLEVISSFEMLSLTPSLPLLPSPDFYGSDGFALELCASWPTSLAQLHHHLLGQRLCLIGLYDWHLTQCLTLDDKFRVSILL